MNKVSTRGISLAKTWKKKQIEELIKQKNEMIDYKIDYKLIDDFIIKEKERINKEYEKRLAKHQIANNDNKKKKEIELLIRDKKYLEKAGLTQKQIDEYIEKGIKEINIKYSTIDFID
jgi:hypothetical protein